MTDQCVRALSVRQAYAELILRGTKKVENRRRPTNIRGRVYIYASAKPGRLDGFRRLKLDPGDLPVGVIVGTVELVRCTRRGSQYRWHLARPRRLPKRKPRNHPQPVWFYPFAK